MAMFFGIILME